MNTNEELKTRPDFEPYGLEWEKEMKKFSKKMLIDTYRRCAILNNELSYKNHELEKDFEKAYAQVLGKPGSHKVLPLSVTANGEYLRKDLVKNLWTTHKDLQSENQKLREQLKEVRQVCYDYEDNIECWKEEGKFRGWPESDSALLEELQQASRKVIEKPRQD